MALWLVQAFLAVGPLRNQLEQMLLLSLVPGLDLLIDVFTLFGESDVVSPPFYIHLLIVFIKDALMTDSMSKRKKNDKPKKSKK